MKPQPEISIHALLAESDRFHFEKTAIVEGFLSTLSLRRATPKGRREKQEAKNFYPRSPCGERRPIDSIAIPSIRISIHALLAESDIADRYEMGIIRQISIHALLAESDGRAFLARPFLL